MKALWILLLCSLLGINGVVAQDTAFTYQGRLTDRGVPAGGTYDLRFVVFSGPAEGDVIGIPWFTNALSISNGQFTALVDFGPGVFTGPSRWLEIGVRTNGDTGTYVILSPRQPVTPVPYALFAPNAGVSGTANKVDAANILGVLATGQLPGSVVINGGAGVRLTGTFSGSGEALTNMELRAANTGGAIFWTTNFTFGFGRAVAHGVGTAPHAVAAGDINGDGWLDLIGANTGDDAVTVLLNDRQGGFVSAAHWSVGAYPSAVVVGDLNNDGRLDLATANSVDGTVTVLTNSGAGFGPTVIIPVGVGPRSLAVGDVNGDGWQDLVSANSGANSLTVLTNNRAGGFGVMVSPGVGGATVCCSGCRSERGWLGGLGERQFSGQYPVCAHQRWSRRFSLGSLPGSGEPSVCSRSGGRQPGWPPGFGECGRGGWHPDGADEWCRRGFCDGSDAGGGKRADRRDRSRFEPGWLAGLGGGQ